MEEDLIFYEAVSPIFAGKKYSIPSPTLCPDCRQQRRLAFRNERNLYSRACDLCKKRIVSVYPENAPFPVYCLTCWWGDGWDPLSFGRDYDPSRPFLDQWADLHAVIPKLAIQNDNGIESENSEYCYDISRCKDCYRLIGSWYDQECHYGLNVNRSRCVVDCNTVGIQSELVYESLDSQHLYHCAYLQNCNNCSDCFFGIDLKGCRHCTACYGLRQKSYCFFNEQLTEEAYRDRVSKFDLGSLNVRDDLKGTFDEWVLRFPRIFAHLQNCEDCEGNNLLNCKSVLGFSVFDSEYCKYVDRSDRPIHCYDLINTGGPQWCYDSVTPDDSYMTHFGIWCWKSKYVLYSDNCHSSEHLFGCISLRRAQRCILNKQYNQEEYEILAGNIIEALEKEGVWGEHLPMRLSPFGYNESAAPEYYPLTENEVSNRGLRWCTTLPYTTGKETIGWEEVGDNIADVRDTITDAIFACQTCGRNYKIIPAELAFYRRMPVPLPRNCPDCRHLARFRRKTPTHLWNRQCANCHKPIATSYSPERPEKILCGECYLREVY